MNKTDKPIKRSKELIQLSRDHHDGLLLCWKIRTGIKNDIAEERILSYVLHFFDANLREHFRQEEEIVFSLLPDKDQMKAEALAQHDILYGMAETMKKPHAEQKKLLVQFADELDNHIRFEERQLFPYIEANAQKEKLQIAGNKIDELHQQHADLLWEDEFWIKKK